MTEAEVKRIQLDPMPVDDREDSGPNEFIRRKKKKYAVLISYSGKGYLGMQR